MTTHTTASPLPTLALAADRTLIRPIGKSVRYLNVRITAPTAPRNVTRPPVHAAFCLDRSGSMAGSKLALAKVAVDTALGRLGATDRFALAAFDDVVEVVTPATPATPAAIGATRNMLRGIDARGSTALFEGCSPRAARSPRARPRTPRRRSHAASSSPMGRPTSARPTRRRWRDTRTSCICAACAR